MQTERATSPSHTRPVTDIVVVETAVSGDTPVRPLVESILQALDAGARAILVDDTGEAGETSARLSSEDLGELGHALRQSGASLAWLIPTPDHPATVNCLRLYHAGSHVLSTTCDREAHLWLSRRIR